MHISLLSRILTFGRVYPDPSILEEAREKIEVEEKLKVAILD